MDRDRTDIIISFLKSEIGGQDLFDALVGFVETEALRSGRYEGCEFVLEKLDPRTFLMYREDVFPDGRIEASDAALVTEGELYDRLAREAKWGRRDILSPIRFAAPLVGPLPEDADIVNELAEALAKDRPSYVSVREFAATPCVTRGELEVAGLVVKKLGAGNVIVFQEQGPEGGAGPSAVVGGEAFAAALDEAVLARGLVPVPGWPTERSLLRTKDGVRNEAKRISKAECARLLSSLDYSRYHVAVLDGALYQDWHSLADELADLYDFPMRDQRNPNAFLDWMCDLDWLGKDAYALFILDYGRFMQNDPRDKKWAMGLFTRWILPFWEKEVELTVVEGKAKPFELFLVD